MNHESLRQEFCAGMDGAADVIMQVKNISETLVDAGYITAGDGVDAAIACAIEDSGSLDQLKDHLEFTIRQLQIFRANVQLVTARETA